MTTDAALDYALGTDVHKQFAECHPAILAALKTRAIQTLTDAYPCVLTDANITASPTVPVGPGATTPPETLLPEDRGHWTEAIGLLAAAYVLRSGDGRQIYTRVKESKEETIGDLTTKTENTFKPIDTDALALDFEGEAFTVLKKIACIAAATAPAPGQSGGLVRRTGPARIPGCGCSSLNQYPRRRF